MQNLDLRAEERSAFRKTADTGLWDILIASVLAMFAVALLLSDRLSDFWSVAVILPCWAAVYVAILIVNKRVVVPRVGRVRWGADRQARLKRLSLTLLTVNIVALVVAIVAFATASRQPHGSWAYPLTLGVTLLVGFSLAAYFLSLPRLFLYGLLLATGPLIGEELFRRGLVSHHGFPVVFGTAAVVIAAIGLLKFALLLRDTRSIDPETARLANDG